MSGTRQSLSLLFGALDVIEGRLGNDDDPGMQAAFAALREAADAYDAAVVAAHPDAVPSDAAAPTEAAEGEIGPRISLFSRWDFTILDRKKLIAQAEELMGEEIGEAATSATILAHVGARNGLAAGGNAKEAGLFWHGTITMAMPCGIAELGDAWVEPEATPFAGLDQDESLCVITDALDERVIPGGLLPDEEGWEPAG